MNALVQPISVEEIPEWLMLEPKSMEVLMIGAQRSNPLFIGTYNGFLGCLLGFIPLTFLSESAFLWMYTTQFAYEHPFVFARASRDVIRIVGQRQYPRIVGISNKSSSRWLRFLGAVITNNPNGYLNFEIRS